MDLRTIYSLEMTRSYDFQKAQIAALEGLGNAVQSLLGGGISTLYTGFGITPTSPASMVVNYTSGLVYQYGNVNTLAWGALGNDTTQIMQQGFQANGSLTLTTAGLSAGKSQYVLIEVGFDQVDTIPADDPNGGVLPFVNPQNPSAPFQGPNNSGSTLDTERLGYATVQTKYGTPANTGLEVAPTPDAGFVGVALVLLTYGQTTITSGNITPSSDTPLLAGLLNSHHGGVAGQAPQIMLASEVQGILPFANLSVSNTSPSGATGIVTKAGYIAIWYLVNGNPNSNLAGNAGDVAFQTNNSSIWVCVTTGNASTAVWDAVGASPAVAVLNTFPASPANYWTNYEVACGVSAAVVNLPPAAIGEVTFYRTDSNTQSCTITAPSGVLNGGVTSTTDTLNPGECKTYFCDGTNYFRKV